LETKYGRPILDRTLKYETPLEAVAKCALLSIDSTMKSNISVVHHQPRDVRLILSPSEINCNCVWGSYLAKMRKLWEDSLKQAFEHMPNIDWQHYRETRDKHSH